MRRWRVVGQKIDASGVHDGHGDEADSNSLALFLGVPSKYDRVDQSQKGYCPHEIDKQVALGCDRRCDKCYECYSGQHPTNGELHAAQYST